MQLQDIPLKSKIKIDEILITFHHLDGMYSYCTVDDGPHQGSVINLSGVTPVINKGDYYEIDDKIENVDNSDIQV